MLVCQFKEHNYRLWLAMDTGNYALGMNQTCKFDGVSSVPPIQEVPTTELNIGFYDSPSEVVPVSETDG